MRGSTRGRHVTEAVLPGNGGRPCFIGALATGAVASAPTSAAFAAFATFRLHGIGRWVVGVLGLCHGLGFSRHVWASVGTSRVVCMGGCLAVQTCVARFLTITSATATTAAPAARALFALRVVTSLGACATRDGVHKGLRGQGLVSGNFWHRRCAAGFALGAWPTAPFATAAFGAAFNARFAPAVSTRFTAAFATAFTATVPPWLARFGPFAIFVARGFTGLRLCTVIGFRAVGAVTAFIASATAVRLVVAATAFAIAATSATARSTVTTVASAVGFVGTGR